MTVPAGSVLLGTVALEPNRWATVDPSGAPVMDVAEWLPTIADVGFDGIELWERHLSMAPSPAAVLASRVPITIYNSYASLDDGDLAGPLAAAGWATKAGALAIKGNVGRDPARRGAYGERLAAWVAALPEHTAFLCECHVGTLAEDPAVAAELLGVAGPRDRVQAIVHSHEPADHLRARFDAYGDRITHVHVNYMDDDAMKVPRLADQRDDLTAKAELLDDLGFRGSWTIEFVRGVLTRHDQPATMLAQAAEDLAVLREVLGATAGGSAP